jgi:hypothetical protein
MDKKRIKYRYDKKYKVYRSITPLLNEKGSSYQIIIDYNNSIIRIKNIGTERSYEFPFKGKNKRCVKELAKRILKRKFKVKFKFEVRDYGEVTNVDNNSEQNNIS